MQKVYTVIDLETTGLYAEKEQITEIGAIKKLEDGTTVGTFHTFVRLTEGRKPSEYTDITEEDCETGMDEIEALKALHDFALGSVVIMQYAPFDLSFVNKIAIKTTDYMDTLEARCDFIDTRLLAKIVDPNESPSLRYVVKRYGIENKGHHRAIADCEMTWDAFQILKMRVRFPKSEGFAYWYNKVMDFDIEGRRLKYMPYGAQVLKESEM